MQQNRVRKQKRDWTFYALGGLFIAFVGFLYGPMMVIYILSFQGPNGGMTFPMVGVSTFWFHGLVEQARIGDIPSAFGRSLSLAPIVSALTVTITILAGLAFRHRFFGSAIVFYTAIASLIMPSILVGFGISLVFRFLGREASLFTSALAAQLTLTVPQGLLAMFVIFSRFNRAFEEAAVDLGASPWQRFRLVVMPIILPGLIGVSIASFMASYDEYARTVLTAGRGNTLSMELTSLTTAASSPTVYAAGTVTTVFSFAVIGSTLLLISWRQRRRHRTLV